MTTTTHKGGAPRKAPDGFTQVLYTRADARLVEAIDAYAARERASNPGRVISRADVVRELIYAGLALSPWTMDPVRPSGAIPTNGNAGNATETNAAYVPTLAADDAPGTYDEPEAEDGAPLQPTTQAGTSMATAELVRASALASGVCPDCRRALKGRQKKCRDARPDSWRCGAGEMRASEELDPFEE